MGVRDRLWRNIALLREGLSAAGIAIPPVASPIIPIIIGESRRTLELSETLFRRGILVVAIRPPAVPRGTSRLRIAVSAAHTANQINFLCDALKDLRCI